MKQLIQQGWLIVVGCGLCALALARGPQGGSTQGEPQTQVLPALPAAANADSNNRMIAVTGTDVTGASILYLIDTESQHITVYQASGGSGSSRGVEFLGARNIALDLMLDGYNDKSEHSFKELRETFEKKGLLAEEPAGAPSGG